MRLNSNIPALRTYTSLIKSNLQVERSMAKLASGYKINKSSDDPAGTSISHKLMMQVKGLAVAETNSLDAISVVQTAEGAMQEMHDMLKRMKELAVQASNDSNESSDRVKMQDEIEQLKQELDSMVNRTEFNGIKLLDGGASTLIRGTEPGYIKLVSSSELFTEGEINFDIVSIGEPAIFESSGTTNLNNPPNLEGIFVVNGERIKIEKTDKKDDISEKIIGAMERTNIVTSDGDFDWNAWINGSGSLDLRTKDAGSNQQIKISGDTEILEALGISAADISTVSEGKDAVLDDVVFKDNNVSYKVNGNRVDLITTTGEKMTFDIMVSERQGTGGEKFVFSNGSDASTGKTGMTIEIKDYGALKIQIGPNKLQEMVMDIPSVSVEALGLKNFNVSSVYTSQKGLEVIDDAISKLSEVRSRFGAYQNRLDYTIRGLNATNEATEKAVSRIRDTDMAWEMTIYTKHNVVEQAGMAILAQANQRPELVMQLIN